MTDCSVVAVNWQETRKCPVGAITLLPGRGACEVLAADGADRIVGYRAVLGDTLSMAPERVAVWRLRELQPWRDLTGLRSRDIATQLDRFNTDVIAVYR